MNYTQTNKSTLAAFANCVNAIAHSHNAISFCVQRIVNAINNVKEDEGGGDENSYCFVEFQIGEEGTTAKTDQDLVERNDQIQIPVEKRDWKRVRQ